MRQRRRLKRLVRKAIMILATMAIFFFGFFVGKAVGSAAVQQPEEEPVAQVITETEETEETCDSPTVAETTTVAGVVHLAGIDLDEVLALPEIPEETEPEEPELVSLGTWKITAYCACQKCCGKSPDNPKYGITATGTVATQGRTIAADPKVLPYGTVVYIDGHAYTVEDCGGAIKNERIDIYFDSHEAALQWGVRYREVFIEEESQ